MSKTLLDPLNSVKHKKERQPKTYHPLLLLYKTSKTCTNVLVFYYTIQEKIKIPYSIQKGELFTKSSSAI